MMATVSTAIILFSFMLVVGISIAFPMHKEKMMDKDLTAKAIRYLWNEENRAEKNQHEHIMSSGGDGNEDNNDDDDNDKDQEESANSGSMTLLNNPFKSG